MSIHHHLYIDNLLFQLVDPLQLSLQSNYSLNVLEEIAVTESFLTLDADIRQCQNLETYEDCITRNYLKSIKGKPSNKGNFANSPLNIS